MASDLDTIFPFGKALRGVIINVEAALGLKFMFNPVKTTTNKSVTYSIEEIPGWDHPDIIFASGGIHKIRFDLFFDKSLVYDEAFKSIGLPLVGTEAVKATFESFLYPQRGILDFIGSTPKFQPPPRVLLILGLRWFECHLEGGADFEDRLFDRMLTPIRLFSSLSFMIIEEGTVNDIRVASRQGLALANSALQVAEIVAEVF